MRKVLFVLIFCVSVFQLRSQILLTQSFDATSFPPTGWTTATGGTGSTRAAWSRVANGANPSNTPHSGAGQAKLNGYDAQNGTATLITPALNFAFSSGFVQVSVWMYRENTLPGAAYTSEGVNVSVNNTASLAGATSLGFIPRNRASTPAESANGWYQYSFLVPALFNGTSNYVVFSGISAYGNNFYIDDIDVSHFDPCNGAPNAGTAFAPGDSICASSPLLLNDTNINLAGVTFQWQSAPAGTGNWTNIAGATTVPYTLNSGITAPTSFRLNVTCTGSAQSSTSNSITVGLKAFFNCYCNSASSQFSVEDNIGQVTIGTQFANPATPPTPLTANPAAVARYTDYTSLGPVNVVPGGNMPFTATQINSNNYWVCGLGVFGDFNHNSSFSDPGETIFAPMAGTAAASSPTFTGTLAIPATALPGITRIRFVLVERTLAITPCATYNWGETEDYLVNVISPMPPAPAVSSNTPVCEGAPITISASIPSYYPDPTYTLSGPGIAPMTNTTGIFTIPASACRNSGAFSVIVTSQGLTSAAASTDVVVNCVPAISVAGITAPANCLVNDGFFDVNGLSPATRYSLYFRRFGSSPLLSRSLTADAAGTVRVTGLAPGSYDSIYVVTPAGCASNAVTQAVVIPTPNPPQAPQIIVSPYPICQGNTVTLLVSNPVANGHYSWTGPGPYSDTGRSIQIPNFNPSATGTYSVVVTVDGCSSAPTTANLNLLSPTPRPVRNNVTYCQYEPAVPMTAQTISGYFVEWFDTCSSGVACNNGIRSRNSTISNPNPPTPDPTVPGIVMWLVRQTAPNGCPSGFDSVYVRVVPKPLPPVPAKSTDSVCQYAVVGPLTVQGSNVKWFTTPTGGVGSSAAPTPSTLVPGTYHFYASQTSPEGCESDRTQVTVIVRQKPEPPVVTSPVNLCQGDPVHQLNAIGQNLHWYALPNGGTGVTAAPVISTNYEDSFFHFVTQTVNTCESDRALIASYVRYKPNGVITAGSQSVCENTVDTFYYYGNGRPDAEYVWFAPLSSQLTSGQQTPGPVVIRFDTAGTSTVQLIINNKGCISRLLAAPITVRPLPELSFVNRQDACADELIKVGMTRAEAGVSGYQWDFGPDATIVYGETRTAGPFGVRYPRAGHYQVTAAATKNGCTSVPKVQDVFVHNRPAAKISYAYRNGTPLDQFCASDTLHLSVQSAPDGATYHWTPSAYFQDRRDTLNSEVSAVVGRSSYVHVAVKDAFGCEATDSLYVPTKPCCGVYFPNAFTPASNIERNRIFRPITTGIHRINSFRVMNRWGQVIWETTSSGAGWDGTFRGVPQDMGTYYFYINYRCEDKNVEDQGELILIR
jgi:gliding motility-associated-like protein